MRIKQITLSCCFLFFIACTQAEHDGQKNQVQEKRTDTVLENRQQKPDTKLLTPINKVTKSEKNLSDFAQDRILDLLNATDSEWIECKDEKVRKLKIFCILKIEYLFNLEVYLMNIYTNRSIGKIHIKKFSSLLSQKI